MDSNTTAQDFPALVRPNNNTPWSHTALHQRLGNSLAVALEASEFPDKLF